MKDAVVTARCNAKIPKGDADRILKAVRAAKPIKCVWYTGGICKGKITRKDMFSFSANVCEWHYNVFCSLKKMLEDVLP